MLHLGSPHLFPPLPGPFRKNQTPSPLPELLLQWPPNPNRRHLHQATAGPLSRQDSSNQNGQERGGAEGNQDEDHRGNQRRDRRPQGGAVHAPPTEVGEERVQVQRVPKDAGRELPAC
ncbi:50S ribosomal protein L29, chloroplastic [Iris pallida]|uniref:50S ribosomal protein L29, chloroplastic n=1 Tax=Iris pallida TaxID=29817 RepID=A0AAX6HKC5_IRIPA|nr:50S ribosomal protein L29, chloroplastic [Iris pallida]